MLQYVPPVTYVDTGEKMMRFVRHVRDTKECAQDTETTGLDRARDRVVLWSACPDEKSIYVFTEPMLKIWAKELAKDPNITWYYTNQTFDFCMIDNSGYPVPVGDSYCTLAMDWLHNENEGHGLKETAWRYLGFSMPSFKDTFPGRKRSEPMYERLLRGLKEDFNNAVAYAGCDAWATFRVFKYLKKALEDESGTNGVSYWDYFREVEMPYTRVLFEMIRRGIMIDLGHLLDIRPNIEKRLNNLQKGINKLAGKQINPRSPIQLVELLFGQLGHEPIYYTSGGDSGNRQPSTDEGVLKTLAGRGCPVSKMLLEHRTLTKFLGTYVDGLEKWADEELRIHPTLTQHVTVTGRASSTDPNLQNIPRPDNDEFGIRGAFIPKPGYIFVVADYCVAPETRILTADLRWVNAIDLAVGNLLIGFDEQISRSTAYRASKVTGKKVLVKPCYKITMSNGVVLTSSHDHMWVGKRQRHARNWIRTDELMVGDQIAHFCEPWSEHTGRGAGYLAGILDGEGWVAKSGRVGFVQKPSPCLVEAEELLRSVPVRWARRKRRKDKAISIEFYGTKGGLTALGILRPPRLLRLAKYLWEGRRTWSSQSEQFYVDKVEYVGQQTVVALQTSSRTFIAEGFLSHNCQLEARIMAHFSGDRNMQRVIKEGKDLWSGTAALMFGVPYEDIMAAVKRKKKAAEDPSITLTPTEKEYCFNRQAAKVIGLALNYGEGPAALAEQLGVSIERAKELIEKYFEPYPSVRDHINHIHNQACSTGLVETVLFRPRRFPELRSLGGYSWRDLSRNERIAVSRGKRQSVNSEIQGSAADLAKKAMLKCEYDPDLKNLGVEMLLQIHDELIFEVPVENVEEAMPRIRENMEHPLDFDLDVPTQVDMGKGYSWSSAKA